MSDIKEEIINHLKKINYPGYSRDIVSFGLVQDIIIENNNIIFLLKVSTDLEQSKDVIKNSIIKLISSKFNFDSIDVQFSVSSEAVNTGLANKVKNIIAVASCKGGVGKSTVAINIASTLAKNYKVGLLDLDIYGPSLPTLVGENEQPQFKNDKIIPIKKFNIDLMSFGFINNENSPAIWRGPMVSRMTQQFFDNVDWGELDYLILDLPPGTGDIQLTLVQKIQLTGAIIVTTPQKLSIVDVQKGSDMFKKVNVPILGIVENMSKCLVKGNIKGFNSVYNDISIEGQHEFKINDNGDFEILMDVFQGSGGLNESKRLGIPLLGAIPLDSSLSKISDYGTPYVLEYPESSIANIFNEIASQILAK